MAQRASAQRAEATLAVTQLRLHAPQLSSLVEKSTSQPSVRFPLQSPEPSVHA